MDWEDIKMFGGVTIFVILLFALITGMVLGATTLAGQKSCEVYAQINQNYNFHWSFWTGCLVKLPDGYWINTDRVQFVNGKLQIALPEN